MWIWIFMLLSIVCIRFLIPDALGEKKKNLIYLGVCFVIVVFFVGSRSPELYGVADLYNYFDRYRDVMTMSIEEVKEFSRMEVGYLRFTKFIATIVPWEYFIIYFEAAFVTGIMFWYIYRNSESVFLSVIIYVCLGPWQFFLTGFRQAFATAICFIALELIKKRNLWRDIVALGLIAFAASLHTMAWIFLVVFIIRRMKLSKNLILYSFLVFVFIILFADKLIENTNEMLDSAYVGSYQGSFLGGLIPIIAYLGALILTYLVWDKDRDTISESDRINTIMLVFGLAIYIARYDVRVMERISYFFTPVTPVVLSNAISRQKPKRIRNIMLAICIALCMFLFIYRASTQLGDYHFYWEYLERGLP